MDTVQGFVLIDVDIVALNNAGKDTATGFENAVVTKKVRRNNHYYAYVSGQAWRNWWRRTLQTGFGWELSPIIREKKIAFTAADPIKHPDDDLFGYMRAAKEGGENITLTRSSPLKNSALISVGFNDIVKNWSVMARQEGEAVPYGKDEYSATMKGMFSISLDQVGTFSSENRSGFKNLNTELRQVALEQGAIEISDPHAKDSAGEPLKLYRLKKETRFQRVKDVISALQVINGGAMQTTNMGDVTPKLIVLCRLSGGNHPFSHLAKEELGRVVFSVEALSQVVSDYVEWIKGKVYVGRRTGFMDELDPDLKKLEAGNGKIVYSSVNAAIKKYIGELENHMP